MAAERFIDLLRRAERFHHDLAGYYDSLSHEVHREDVRLILDYMRRHEEFLEHCLREYERDAPRGVTEAWFRVLPDAKLLDLLQRAEVNLDMTVDEVVAMALHYDDCLIRLYRRLAETAISAEVQSALEALLLLEEAEERKLVRNLQFSV